MVAKMHTGVRTMLALHAARVTLTLHAILIVTIAGCASRNPSPCVSTACGASLPSNGSENGKNPDATAQLRPANGTLGGAPAWALSGASSKYPSDQYLTGIAAAKGDDALKRAIADAAADLANRITVRIEHELTDVSSEKNGKLDYHVAAMTRLTSDVRIQAIQFETAHVGADVYALAYVKRADAATEQRMLLERALLTLRACMTSARTLAARANSGAAAAYHKCIPHITDGLQHDAVARIVELRTTPSQTQQELVQSLQEIRDATTSAMARPATSLKEVAEFLSMQLSASGSVPYVLRDAPTFRYGVTNFASALGQQLSASLESALAQRLNVGDARAANTKDAVIRGVYLEEGDDVRVTATLVEVGSGKIVGGAETSIAKSKIPPGIGIRPKNLEAAMAEQRLLSEGELVSGALRLELWTDKGRRGVVYAESEQIRLFFRVNAPAYVRLIYVLQSGIQVPVDQGYYVDASKVNMAVEYPDRFEVAPPFGVEHIHATAFTQQQAPLPVTSKVIDGQTYTVVEDGLSSMVRHRGIKRVGKDEVAETLLSITTLPSIAQRSSK